MQVRNKQVPLEGTHRVFVYGTLKKGFPNHKPYIQDNGGKFICNSVMPGLMFHQGGFPAVLIDKEVTSKVHGEVWEVDNKSLREMDVLEGVPYHYTREEVDLGGNIGKVWVYVYPWVYAKELNWVVPQGLWLGNEKTPKCRWLGANLPVFREVWVEEATGKPYPEALTVKVKKLMNTETGEIVDAVAPNGGPIYATQPTKTVSLPQLVGLLPRASGEALARGEITKEEHEKNVAAAIPASSNPPVAVTTPTVTKIDRSGPEVGPGSMVV